MPCGMREVDNACPSASCRKVGMTEKTFDWYREKVRRHGGDEGPTVQRRERTPSKTPRVTDARSGQRFSFWATGHLCDRGQEQRDPA